MHPAGCRPIIIEIFFKRQKKVQQRQACFFFVNSYFLYKKYEKIRYKSRRLIPLLFIFFIPINYLNFIVSSIRLIVFFLGKRMQWGSRFRSALLNSLALPPNGIRGEHSPNTCRAHARDRYRKAIRTTRITFKTSHFITFQYIPSHHH